MLPFGMKSHDPGVSICRNGATKLVTLAYGTAASMDGPGSGPHAPGLVRDRDGAELPSLSVARTGRAPGRIAAAATRAGNGVAAMTFAMLSSTSRPP